MRCEILDAQHSRPNHRLQRVESALRHFFSTLFIRVDRVAMVSFLRIKTCGLIGDGHGLLFRVQTFCHLRQSIYMERDT